MKNLLLSVIATMTLMSNCLSQNIKHEKKSFVGEDGKIYWNKELPVFISLSTSPGGDAHLMKSNGNEEPYYFDTEGTNWIRTRWAVDDNGNIIYPKRDAIWPVENDGLPPVSAANYLSKSRKVINGKTYYGPNLKVELSATDKTSGVEKIYYSLSGTFQAYGTAIEISNEKGYELEYYAVDMVGNVEKIHNLSNDNATSFEIDATPPETTFELVGSNINNILSPNTVIKLTSNDEKSGVQSISYSWDDGKGTSYTSPISLNSLEEGEHSLTFYATDHVENEEGQKQYKMFLDKTGPSMSLNFNMDSFEKDGKTYVSERTNIDLSGTDNKAGLEKIFLNQDKKDYSEYSEAIGAGKNGYHTISYFGVDKVENKSRVVFKEYLVDGKAPSLSYTVSGPKYTRNDTLFIRNTSEFIISTSEGRWNDSGVKSVNYEINGTEYKYSSDFTIAGDGIRNLIIKASDNVNNLSIPITQVIFLDNIAPVISHHFSVGTIGKKTVRDKEYVIYPKDAMLFLAATDEHVGASKIFYKISGGSEKLYVKPIALTSYTNVEIEVRTIDHLGNQSTLKLDFAVE